MTELWLKFTDEKGADRRVRVEGAKFVVGRHSECDLSIPNGKLSRQHVKIETFGEVSVASDCGSSNGTTVNGVELRDPVALKDGDVLNLGGGVEMRVEMVSDRPQAAPAAAENEDEEAENNYSSGAGAASGGANSVSAASNDSSIPSLVFIVAPALVILMLVCGGGLIFFYGGASGNSNNRQISTYDPTPDETPEKSATPKASATIGGGTTTTSPSPEETSAPPTPETSNEKKQIEINSALFLQRIARNDSTAFLKSTEIDIVSSKIAPFKNSSALAENFKAVKANSSQFQSLAQSEGLKPQFLAVAALTEIGNNRGNPLEVAQRMLPVFKQLKISLDNNLADDNLLMIAAYDQGKAGKFKDLRNALEALAKKNPSVGPREIRTIWFLKKQDKITDAEYEFALRFLAIGTITQNPKGFGVNSEAVIFN